MKGVSLFGWPVLLAMALASCGGQQEEHKREPPLVSAAPAVTHEFIDTIEAVGTARANEQVTIASPVTERLERVMFDDGMVVARGQLLAVLSQGQQTAMLDGALASEREAQSQYGRIESLYDRGFATHAQLDQQRASAELARARAAEARAEIADRMIRAPFAGYTSLRQISAGAIVTAGTPIVTVSDISRIKLDFTVPEARLADLRVGQVIEAEAAAYPGAPFAGTISTIDPVIDPESRAILVRAIVRNPDARIKPGMLLTVRVRTGERQASAIPELAVRGDGDKRYVFVVDGEGNAKRVDVKTGARDAGLIEVAGLPRNARVVAEGVLKVNDGGKVRIADNAPQPVASASS